MPFPSVIDSLLHEAKIRLKQYIIRLPGARRTWNATQYLYRRIAGKPRTVTESPNLLPLLIQVLAAFSKREGQFIEADIDSSLGFLRHDFPEAVYSELRTLFREALQEQQDLGNMASKLASQLGTDRKMMLGIQLFDLIARAGLDQNKVSAFHTFMTQLGMATQAIDIVRQLNEAEDVPDPTASSVSPLETLTFGRPGSNADVFLDQLNEDGRITAFRYHDLLIVKNRSAENVSVRSRPLKPSEFCRIHAGQRVLVGDQVLNHQDLTYYFNAKKNIQVTQIYLSVDEDGEVEIEKERSRDSCLEIRFGLKVVVRCIKEVDARIGSVQLRPGSRIEATLHDIIHFQEDAELPIADLRRRARAMGGRFLLKSYKSSYLVSNDPAQLDVDDILLSPGTSGEFLLRIICNYENRSGKLEIIHSDRPIYVGDLPLNVGGTCELKEEATIRLDAGQVLRCDFTERILEEERNTISTLEIRDLTFGFKRNRLALDGISFAASRGEMICVMGASASGKSTLLRTVSGQLFPSRGSVLLNGHPLHETLDSLKHFLAYIPQDDAFDDNLTIVENMTYAAAVRAPHLSSRDRLRRIESKLIELGLAERRNSLVGSANAKRLSGGERKRLNIGLDMISSADVLLFDEPTSGLSSKDSEHVLEIIRSAAHNKIVLVTLHQPTSKLFHMFSKAILLDKGGQMVFFGTPQEMLSYFAEAEHEQHLAQEIGGCPACGTTRPEFIFDVLETPLRDLSGDIIYEENTQGQLVPARRFSPGYWRDRFESFRLIQEVKQVNLKNLSALPAAAPVPVNLRRRVRFREEWLRFRTMLQRNLRSKMRSVGTLTLTLVVPPLLAGIVGWALYYTDNETGRYDFARAFHIPTYIFIALLVAMFLALMNSVDDIIRDRVILNRERNLNIFSVSYILSKAFSLSLFSAIQCAIFVLVGNTILQVRGMFLPYWGIMFVTAFSGIALGLLISSIATSSRMAANCVPLVLIPQLIFGGALIKYEEMNRDSDLFFTVQKWVFENYPDTSAPKDQRLRIPAISKLVATHYSYEALIVAQAQLNPLTKRQNRIQTEIDQLLDIKEKDRSKEQNSRLNLLGETLATLSGLNGSSRRDVERKLTAIDQIIHGRTTTLPEIDPRNARTNAQKLFTNNKVGDMVAKAEADQRDYRKSKPINVFFSPRKYIANFGMNVLAWNSLVLTSSSAVILALVSLIVSRQMRPQGTESLLQNALGDDKEI